MRTRLPGRSVMECPSGQWAAGAEVRGVAESEGGEGGGGLGVVFEVVALVSKVGKDKHRAVNRFGSDAIGGSARGHAFLYRYVEPGAGDRQGDGGGGRQAVEAVAGNRDVPVGEALNLYRRLHRLPPAALAEESGQEARLGGTTPRGRAQHPDDHSGDRQQHDVELYRMKYLIHNHIRACMRAWEISM